MFIKFIDNNGEMIDGELFIKAFKHVIPSKSNRIVSLDNDIYVVEDVLFTRNQYNDGYVQITLSKTGEKAEPTIAQKIHNIIEDKTIKITGVKSVAYNKYYEDKKYDSYSLRWVCPHSVGSKPRKSDEYMSVNYSHDNRIVGEWRFEHFTPEWQDEILKKVEDGDYVIC